MPILLPPVRAYTQHLPAVTRHSGNLNPLESRALVPSECPFRYNVLFSFRLDLQGPCSGPRSGEFFVGFFILLKSCLKIDHGRYRNVRTRN